jgi:hypothetical protein
MINNIPEPIKNLLLMMQFYIPWEGEGALMEI